MKDPTGKEAVALTVCLAVKGMPPLLKAALLSLRRQTLDRKLWRWAALAPSEKELKVLQKTLLSLPPPGQKDMPVCKPSAVYLSPRVDDLRLRALHALKTPFVFFMDEDVMPPPQHLERILKLFQKLPSAVGLGGAYVSGSGCPLPGRVYNLVSSLSLKRYAGYLLGGNMALQTRRLPPEAQFKSFLKGGFGGEEIFFFKRLQEAGLSVVRAKELAVEHRPGHTWLDLIKRAWLHGKAASFYPPQEKRRFLSSARLAARLFLSQPAAFHIKILALAYLALVRFAKLCSFSLRALFR